MLQSHGEVKNVPVTSNNIKPGNIVFSTNTSQFTRIYNVIVDTKKWFDGEMVTCTIRDTNNDRDVKQEIHLIKEVSQCSFQIIDFVALCVFILFHIVWSLWMLKGWT